MPFDIWNWTQPSMICHRWQQLSSNAQKYLGLLGLSRTLTLFLECALDLVLSTRKLSNNRVHGQPISTKCFTKASSTRFWQGFVSSLSRARGTSKDNLNCLKNPKVDHSIPSTTRRRAVKLKKRILQRWWRQMAVRKRDCVHTPSYGCTVGGEMYIM